MGLWRQAHKLGATTTGAAEVRRVHCPGIEVEGYSIEEVDALLAAAAAMRGEVSRTRIPCNLYWTSLVRTLWDTGLRSGDVLAITTSSYDLVGRLWVYEHKTGKSGWHKLRPSTNDAIAACIAATRPRSHIWPGLKPRSFCRAFGRLAAAACLPGTSRWLRSGSGSAVERDNPGQGWRFLNHSGPTVFEKHYRIDKVCQPESIMPPEIGSGPDGTPGGKDGAA